MGAIDAVVISIHAPVKGATHRCGIPAKTPDNFNPRSREGSDDHGIGRRGQKDRISIHAPVKGATATTQIYAEMSDISIHAPVKGATSRAMAQVPSSGTEFQSTLP